jgi:hypothetical protein
MMFIQNSKLLRKFAMYDNFFSPRNCFEESGDLKWYRAVTVLLHTCSLSKHPGTGQ